MRVFHVERFSHNPERIGIHPVPSRYGMAVAGHHVRTWTVSTCLVCNRFWCLCEVVPEPAEPEEMTVELAVAYIKMEIEEVSLIQSRLASWEQFEETFQDGKRAGLQLALGILNQTA